MLGLIVGGVGCFPLHMPIYTPSFLTSVSRPTETVKYVDKIGVGFVLSKKNRFPSTSLTLFFFFFLNLVLYLVSSMALGERFPPQRSFLCSLHI